MNVLILGSGGREHALGWKLKQSPDCGKLYFAPGNAGTAELGENLAINPEIVNTKTVDEIDYFARRNEVELIVIGPEDPLAHGLADRLKRKGRYIFGPEQAAAQLEANKAYCKHLLRSAAIPTAEARLFKDAEAAQRYAESRDGGMVVKAAGLAKGKGVVVCDTPDEAVAAVRQIMVDRAFGEAGDEVIIEEKLKGLEPAQDHKQAHEGDKGPNTGGMGAYTPTPLATEKLLAEVERDILVPTVDALRRDGVEYRGVLYAGLMLTPAGPKVLEYNCRFGDPEVQPLMMRLNGDLLKIMIATAEGKLDTVDLDWDPRCCCCVVMASGGYPGPYEKGKVITGIEDAEKDADVKVFHAGTARSRAGDLITAGGRVLNVCARGRDLKEAQQKANAACGKIHFEGAFFRKDIGFRVM